MHLEIHVGPCSHLSVIDLNRMPACAYTEYLLHPTWVKMILHTVEGTDPYAHVNEALVD